MICDNVLEAVGGTPLVRLRRMTGPDDAQVLVKFEAVNVGGSVKTRTALKMVERAEERGELTPDSVIVEPTSGNQGVGLALVAAVKGYAARIIMPDSCSVERRRIMEHYGAEVICVHDEGDIGACIEECIALAQKMAAEDPRVFVPQQFVNRDNLAAHVDGTAAEILADVRAAASPSTASAPGLARVAPSPASALSCARSSPPCRSGRPSPSTQRCCPAAPSAPMCRWASAMASCPPSWIPHSSTRSSW